MQGNKIKIYIYIYNIFFCITYFFLLFFPKILCQISLYGYVLPTFFVAIVYFPKYYGEVDLFLKIYYMKFPFMDMYYGNV